MNRYEFRRPQNLSPSSLFAGARSGRRLPIAAFKPFLAWLLSELNCRSPEWP